MSDPVQSDSGTEDSLTDETEVFIDEEYPLKASLEAMCEDEPDEIAEENSDVRADDELPLDEENSGVNADDEGPLDEKSSDVCADDQRPLDNGNSGVNPNDERPRDEENSGVRADDECPPKAALQVICEDKPDEIVEENSDVYADNECALGEESSDDNERPLKATLQAIFDSEKYNDVTFLVAKKEVCANEIVVKTRSSVLKQLIEDAEEKGQIVLDEHNVENFKAFIKFLYIDACDINVINVIAMYLLGKKYNVPSLCKKCLAVFDDLLTEGNALSFAATTFRDSNLIEIFQKCLDLVPTIMDNIKFFYVDNLNEIAFVFPSSVVLHILKQPRANDAEEALFHKVFEWAKLQCKTENLMINAANIKEVMKDFIPYIRFENLTTSTLASTVRANNLLTTQELLSQFCRIAMQKPNAKSIA